jgi:DNA-binding MarR family transcriptional regulator
LIRDADLVRVGRARALELTDAGRKRLTAAHRAVMAVDDAMTEGLSAAARRALAVSLLQCADSLDSVDV